MGNDFIISIRGIQKVDNDFDETKLILPCSLEQLDDLIIIKYSEFDENNKKLYDSTLKIENDDLVTILKNGKVESKLILEKNKCHICPYYTNFGVINLKTFTKEIICDIEENKGRLKLKYDLYEGPNFLSENSVFISLKRSEKNV